MTATTQLTVTAPCLASRVITFNAATRSQAADAFASWLDFLADALDAGVPAELIGGKTRQDLGSLREILDALDKGPEGRPRFEDADLPRGRAAWFKRLP